MDGIIQLQAEYGKDTTGLPTPNSGDGTVDVFDTTAPTSTDLWARVLAIRVAVLARSSEFDKTHCSANPQWTRGNPGAAKVMTDFVMRNADGTADSFADCVPGPFVGTANPNNWRHYRYRVFETVIPLRNHIWFPLS
jgi:type IV pilus assembly protein PilW